MIDADIRFPFADAPAGWDSLEVVVDRRLRETSYVLKNTMDAKSVSHRVSDIEVFQSFNPSGLMQSIFLNMCNLARQAEEQEKR